MVVLCEVRIYVRSAMVERRVLLGQLVTEATQGARSVDLRSHVIAVTKFHLAKQRTAAEHMHGEN